MAGQTAGRSGEGEADRMPELRPPATRAGRGAGASGEREAMTPYLFLAVFILVLALILWLNEHWARR